MMLQYNGQSITSKEDFERVQPIKLVLSIYTQSLIKKKKKNCSKAGHY